MRTKTTKQAVQVLNVQLSLQMYKRLRLEAARTGESLRSLTSAALDCYLPQSIEIITSKDARRVTTATKAA